MSAAGGEPAAAGEGPRAARPRRERSVTEILLSIVLVLEAILVFFVTLVVFGLDILEPGVAFGGGGALILLLVIGARLLRWAWGVWFGWMLQAVILATGLLVPLMYLVAAMFFAIWVYCFVRGRQLDRRNSVIEARLREQARPDSTPPDAPRLDSAQLDSPPPTTQGDSRHDR